jgi:hypothetical protein
MRHICPTITLSLFFAIPQTHAAVIADFATNFGTANNPNSGSYGTWSCDDGAAPFPTYINGKLGRLRGIARLGSDSKRWRRFSAVLHASNRRQCEHSVV